MKDYIDNNKPPAGHEMKIVYIAPKELIPYENNPRMNDGGVQPVIESIKAYGFKVPIVVDSNNVVVCGHTRLKAALQMGQTLRGYLFLQDDPQAGIHRREGR